MEESYWLAMKRRFHARANSWQALWTELTVGAPAAAATPQPAFASDWRQRPPHLCTPGTWHHINGVSHRLLQKSVTQLGCSGGAAARDGPGRAAQPLSTFHTTSSIVLRLDIGDASQRISPRNMQRRSHLSRSKLYRWRSAARHPEAVHTSWESIFGQSTGNVISKTVKFRSQGWFHA